MVIDLNVNSRGDEETPGRTKAGERHRIAEEVKEGLVGEGARQHRIKLAKKRIMAERGSQGRSQPGNLP